MSRLKKHWVIMAVMLLVIGLTGCTTPGGRTAGAVIDDASITAQVKEKLFNDPYLSGLRGFAVSVSTFKGEVTLTGTAESTKARTRASEIAVNVMGVRKVNNLLKIK